MAKSRMALETELRKAILAEITNTLKINHETDVLPTSPSEITIPVVDSEGNERYALIKVSIPRGTRNGNGGYTEYNGYAAAQEYEEDMNEKLAKKKASEEKKALAAKVKEAKRTVRKLNKEGIDKMIHEDESPQYLDREIGV